MKEIIYALKVYYSNAEEVEKIIINCALVAAASDVVGSIIPGVALISLVVSCVGAVWVMYAEICKALGIKFSENMLKILARAVLSNLAANAAALVGGGIVATFIPGFSVAASAVLVFVCVYLAGMLFAQMLAKLAKQNNGRIFDLTTVDADMCSEILKSNAEAAVKDEKLMRDIRKAYKDNKGK